MYSIVNVIYGIPLDSNTWRPHEKYERSDEMAGALDGRLPGFMTFYRGDSDGDSFAFGILLDEFDQCVHHTNLEDLPLRATADMRKRFKKLFNKLSPELQAEMKNNENFLGTPRVFFLWSTS